MVAVTATANISTLTYAAGETIALDNSVNSFVRLTIDGQTASDVTKVETYRLGDITCLSVSGEILIKNTSTTAPLVLDFNALGKVISASTAMAKIKMAGAWISLGSGSGALGQTVNFATLTSLGGAKTINFPPFVQVERESGSGALITTTPTAGATYTNNSSTYTVVSATVANGRGIMICTRTTGTNDTSGAILTKASGTGDATLGFRHCSKTGTLFTFLIGEAYVTMLNIGGGTRNDTTGAYTQYTDKNSVAYTAGANLYLDDCGVTWETGHFFEFDEFNSSLKFAKRLIHGIFLDANRSMVLGDVYSDGTNSFTVFASTTTTNVVYVCGTVNPAASGTLTRTSGTGPTPVGYTSYSTRAGGWIPPNGANIRIPNIHITANASAGVTAASRCKLNAAYQNSAQIDLSVCSFSTRWTMTDNQYWSNITYNHFGYCGRYTGQTVQGNLSVYGQYEAPDTWIINNGQLSYPGVFGTFSLDNVYTAHRGDNAGRAFLISDIGNLVRLGEVHATSFGRAVTYVDAAYLQNIVVADSTSIDVGPLYVSGNPILVESCANVRIKDLYHSDTTSGMATTANAAPAIKYQVYNRNCIIETIRLMPGGAPNYGAFLECDSNSKTMENIAVHDVVYNGANPVNTADWTNVAMRPSGKRLWFTDWTINGLRSSATYAGNYPYTEAPHRKCNIRSDTSGLTGYISRQDQIEMVQGNAPSTTFSGSVDNYTFQVWLTGGTTTTGLLGIVPGSLNSTLNERTAVTGAEGVDWYLSGTGTLYTPGVIDLRYKASKAIRGITSFASAVFNISAGSSTNTTYAFRLCKWGDDITATSFVNFPAHGAAATAVQTMFAALSGYDSLVGLDFEFKVTTSAGLIGRSLYSVWLSACTMNSTFALSEIGFIQVGYTGATNGASVAAINTLTTAVQVGYTTADSTGAYKFEYPYAYNGVPASFRIVARKAGYGEAIIDSTCYQAGKSVPAVQVLNNACTDSDIDAANLVLNGTAKTFSVSAAHTLAELYRRAQWWAHQNGNMLYDTPLITKDGVNFTQPSTWTISGLSYLSGGNILGGIVTVAAPATLAVGFSGVTMNIPGAGTYTASIASSLLRFTPTGGSAVYTMTTGTYSGTITLENMTAYSMTVKLPPGTSYTNNSPGTITVDVSATVTVKVTVKSNSTGSPIQNARVRLVAAAGGDLTAGTVILSGLSDVNGVIQDVAFVYTNTQPVTGKARFGSGSPKYKTGDIVGSITSAGFDNTVLMLGDE